MRRVAAAALRALRGRARLLREQPRVQRVAHGAEAHDRIPTLHVPVRVPRHGGDDVAGLDAQPLQCEGQEPAGVAQLVAFFSDIMPCVSMI